MGKEFFLSRFLAFVLGFCFISAGFCHICLAQDAEALSFLHGRPLSVGVFSNYDYAKDDSGEYGNAKIFSEILLKDFNIKSIMKRYPNSDSAREALLSGDVDVVFGLRDDKKGDGEIIYANEMFPRLFHIISSSDKFADLKRDNIRDLFGKKFLIYRNTNADYFVGKLLNFAPHSFERNSIADIVLEVDNSNSVDHAIIPADFIEELMPRTRHVVIAEFIKDYSGKIATTKKFQPFITMLNKYIEQNDKRNFNMIASQEDRNVLGYLFRNSNILTNEERELIKSLEKIDVYTDDVRNPTAFWDKDGDFRGISRDFLDEFSFVSGIKFNYKKKISKEEILSIAKNLKNNEIIVQFFRFKDLNNLDVVDSHFYTKFIIFSNSNDKKDWVNSGTIGVINNSLGHQYISSIGFTNIQVHKDVDDLFRAVRKNEVDFGLIFNQTYYDKLYKDEYDYKRVGLLPVSFEFPMFVSSAGSPISSLYKKAMDGYIKYPEIITNWENKPDTQIASLLWQHSNEEKRQLQHKIFLTICVAVLLIAAVILFAVLRAKKVSLLASQSIANNAREASKAKSLFLSNMSHEIRTPLNAILGLSQVAIRSQEPQEALNAVRQIHNSGKHLLALINDILDMSKIEADKLEIVNGKFSIIDLTKDIETMFKGKMQEKVISFSVDIDKRIPEYLSGDSLRIYQIIMNLVSNAVKFTPDGGKIWLSVDVIEETPDNIELSFAVKDSGIGISEEKQAKLFQLYEQGEADVAKNFGGTGLGLMISKKLSELMGGTLYLSSALGKGTTFTLRLKLDKISEAELEKEKCEDRLKTSSTKDISGMRVLLIDDVEINRIIIKKMLEPCKIKIDEACDGKAGLEIFEKSASGYYHAVLMDIHMPVMDGYEATRAIRKLERPDAKSIYIIALTASAFKEDIDAAKLAGLNSHISKPVDLEKLIKMMQNTAEIIGYKNS